MRVIAFYSFFKIEELEDFQKKIFKFFENIQTKGIILIGPEGLNGTIAVSQENEKIVRLFLENLGTLRENIKVSDFDGKIVFNKFKIKIKKEIVTSDFDITIDEIRDGQFIDSRDWEKFISQDDILIMDTRNDYEFKIGHFKNSVNPNIKTFREFKSYIEKEKRNLKRKKIAIYCTGGIRCEKAGALMQKHGLDTYQLKGGILKYFEETSASSWEGECFVFDYRVSVDKNLQPGSSKLCFGCNMPLTQEERQSPQYEEGFTCPNCIDQLTDRKKRSLTDKREHWKRIF